MIDHVKLFVRDLRHSREFFRCALAELDYRLLVTRPAGDGRGEEAAFGVDFPHLWIAQSERPTIAHVALRARDRAAVQAFHRAALAAGGTDHGAPGPRPHYHPGYYGAFVLDPDGNNIEAVCHEATAGAR